MTRCCHRYEGRRAKYGQAVYSRTQHMAQAQSISVICETPCALIRAAPTPHTHTYTNPALISLSLSLITAQMGSFPWSTASKTTISRVNLKSLAHTVRQRERRAFIYWLWDLMKQPITCSRFLETWHYKIGTEWPRSAVRLAFVCMSVTCWPW